jgi:glycolate oxidase FAD binding subunit
LITVLEGPERIAPYAIDGQSPRTVALPATEAEAASALKAAAEAGEVVVPWGAGTKQDFGNPVEQPGVVLSLERLNQVVEYVPTDMTITVQAGMRFADLQALTAAHSQTVPLDPARASAATIGGIVATAVSGPRRAAYGAVRDLLLGCRIALTDGRVIQAGGKVVKNVAGYDIAKLMAGSFGTLGVITEVSLKLRPLPADTRTLVFGFASLEEALAASAKILASELLPAALVVLTPRASGRLGALGAFALAAALEETPENNAYQAGRLAQIAGGAATLTGDAERLFWDALIDYGDRFGASFHIREATVISDLPAPLGACADEGAGALDGIAYVQSGTAMLYGFAPPTELDAMEAAVKARFRAAGACGSAVLESGPVALRRRLDVWGLPRPEWKMAERIRRTFDPKRILNRGRFVGGL